MHLNKLVSEENYAHIISFDYIKKKNLLHPPEGYKVLKS